MTQTMIFSGCFTVSVGTTSELIRAQTRSYVDWSVECSEGRLIAEQQHSASIGWTSFCAPGRTPALDLLGFHQFRLAARLEWLGAQALGQAAVDCRLEYRVTPGRHFGRQFPRGLVSFFFLENIDQDDYGHSSAQLPAATSAVFKRFFLEVSSHPNLNATDGHPKLP